MHSRKLLALILSLIAGPAIAGYMTLLGAGSFGPAFSWIAGTDAFPDTALSYSGPSLSTMFNSAGGLTYKPNNLLTYSNTLSSAAWTRSNVGAPTGGQSDPLGGTNAWLLTPSGANPLFYQGTAGTGANQIASIWLKSDTGSSFNLTLSFTGSGVTPNPTNLTITVTTSWQQFNVPVATSAGFTINFCLGDGSTGWVNGNNLLVYAPTLSAVTYETTARIGDQVATTSSAYYGPRIDYDPNTLVVKGLLIEESKTNRFFPSVGSATWLGGTGNATFSYNDSGTLAPDGTQTATLMTATGVNGFWELQATASASSIKTSSVWIKRKTGSGSLDIVDVRDAAWHTVAEPTGWTRVSYTDIASTLNWGGFRIQTSGDAIWIWGFQIEDGTYPTSYIPATTAAVARAADIVQFTEPASATLQGSAGTFIIESISESGSSPATITNIVSGTNSILYRNTTGKTGTTNGTTALLTATTPAWNASVRNGLAWSTGRSLAYTGSAVATDANAVSNVGTLYLGSNNGSAVENGWYKSFALWNQRLSDTMLQTKLTVGGSYTANDNGARFADNDNLPIHWRVAL